MEQRVVAHRRRPAACPTKPMSAPTSATGSATACMREHSSASGLAGRDVPNAGDAFPSDVPGLPVLMLRRYGTAPSASSTMSARIAAPSW